VPIAEAQGSCDNLRMDEEDLIRAKGKTLHEYQQCKDRLRTLEAEAVRAAKMLDAISAFLRNARAARGSPRAALGTILTPRR